MKKLDTTAITTAVGFPVKSGTLLFLQQAFQEMGNAAIQAIIGSSYDATKVYILFGCVATGADPGVRTFSAGAVFFNGEVFIVPAAAFTSVDVSVGTIVTSYFNDPTADPVTFTDGVPRSAHQIRQVIIADGASGSGGTGGGGQPNFDFSNWLTIVSATYPNIFSGSLLVSVDSAGGGTATGVTLPGLNAVNVVVSKNLCIVTFTVQVAITGAGSVTLKIEGVPAAFASGYFYYGVGEGLLSTGSADCLLSVNTGGSKVNITVRNSVAAGSVFFLTGQITYHTP